jgi:predicted nucleic acid-binding protein
MKVVVADTSPLNYLVLVDAVGILPELYGRVTVPQRVLNELADENAPKKVARRASAHPAWVEVQPVRLSEDPTLTALDDGEHAAILLAEKQYEVLLLIDDSAGRMEASRRGIATTGTLGVLRAASQRKLVDLPEVLDRLMATNFRISRTPVEELIAECGQK